MLLGIIPQLVTTRVRVGVCILEDEIECGARPVLPGLRVGGPPGSLDQDGKALMEQMDNITQTTRVGFGSQLPTAGSGVGGISIIQRMFPRVHSLRVQHPTASAVIRHPCMDQTAIP